MNISRKIDDLNIFDLVAKAEDGSDWARRAAWVKVYGARDVLDNRSWCRVAGEAVVAKLDATVAAVTARLAAI